eukprot:scaffold1112_cov354-Pavlova_lutheri.AAC.4
MRFWCNSICWGREKLSSCTKIKIKAIVEVLPRLHRVRPGSIWTACIGETLCTLGPWYQGRPITRLPKS